MAASGSMAFTQLFGCFGAGGSRGTEGGHQLDVASREDSARHHSIGSDDRTRSVKIQRSDSPKCSRPWASDDPSAAQQRRSAKPRIDRRQHGSSERQHSSRCHDEQSSRHHQRQDEQPRSPTASLDPWMDAKRYSFVGDLSSRSGCTVTKLMQHKKSGELVAVRFLCRSCAIDDTTEAELLSHLGLDSPHIGRFKEVFLTEQHLAVVAEHAPGGPLFRHVVHCGRLPEPEARSLFRQLLAGVAHCHSQGVCHRDLRLESLRLDARGGLRIGDFAYASARPGTRCDLWACGVILYVMVFGRYPFDDDTAGGSSRRSYERERRIQRIVRNLCGVKYVFPKHVNASPEVQNLLERVFVLPSKTPRIELSAIAEHPWVTNNGALPPVPMSSSPAGTLRSLGRVTPLDLLTGDDLAQPSAPSTQPPESPLDARQRPSGGGFFRRSKGDRPQTALEIAAIMRKAHKARR